MSTNIFICQTPFQLMVTMIIRMSLNSDDINDVVITSAAVGMKNRAEKIKELNVFRNVFYIDTGGCNNNSHKIIRQLKKEKCEIFGCNLKTIKTLPYDYTEIYSIDVTCVTSNICREMQRRKARPVIHLYEEGFGCYTDYYYKHLFNKNFVRDTTITVVSKVRRLVPVMSCVQDLLLFEPDLLRWKTPFAVRQIRKTKLNCDVDLVQELNYVFEYESDASAYKQRVIFFEDCIFQDTGDSRDFSVIKTLTQRIGRNDILVKMHPRTQINRFQSEGIETIKKQGIPWEIVAMNMKENDKHVFVTFTSSAVVTYSLLFKKHYLSILLFKCIPEFAQNINPDILAFLEEYAEAKPEVLFIPNTLEEAYEKIEMIVRGDEE